ncbi:MAG: heme-binding protein, partial [Anaerolineaceae bacterium]|nr:heme-binding protein [Anaerolineaceae bacterium]
MTETLKYTVIRKEKNIELRDYAEYIQAEVSVESRTFRLAVEKAFNVLAGYIFGNNISKQKIAMTTPVTTSRSERIAMTTPVTVSGKGIYTVAFSMPSQYSMESLPLPKDERVH